MSSPRESHFPARGTVTESERSRQRSGMKRFRRIEAIPGVEGVALTSELP